MTDRLTVYDMSLKKVAILQNAFEIKEEQEINNIYNLSFNIPSTDAKVQYCQPFYYYRFGDSGQLYRGIKRPKRTGSTPVDTVFCEHVIATLCDNVLFGAHTYGGRGTHTREVIEYILSKQAVQNWVLKDCDFDRQFEYNWEQENLLNALYSVPKVFTEPYMWDFDTSVYPWKLSLKRIDPNGKPTYYIRAEKNLLFQSSEADYTNICTRIWPLGYGEGINQLNIAEINGGKKYLDAPAAVIARYGVKEKVLVDRRFEKAETLMAYAQSMLDALSVPAMTQKFSVIDLYPLTSEDIDKAEVGKICRLTEDGSTAYITKTTQILDDPGNLSIDLSTKASDVISAIADLADRVRIESVYAQGATQLYQHSKDANATPEKGMVMSLYFPGEMRQINKVLLRMQLEKFRSYSATTEISERREESTENSRTRTVTASTANALSKTISSGPSSASTTSAMNFDSFEVGYNTNSGRHFTESASGEGTHNHGFYADHTHSIPGNRLRHSHGMSHTHEIEIDISGHSHTVEIPEHSHYFVIPPHAHKIDAGIFESGRPSAFDIYVDGNKVASVDDISYEDDITMWLLGEDGLVPRNRWIDMEIRPNDNAYVVASVFIQGFVQSRGGGNY